MQKRRKAIGIKPVIERKLNFKWTVAFRTAFVPLAKPFACLQRHFVCNSVFDEPEKINQIGLAGGIGAVNDSVLEHICISHFDLVFWTFLYFVKNEESDYRTENYNMENEIIIKNRKIRKFKKIKKVKFQLNNVR